MWDADEEHIGVIIFSNKYKLDYFMGTIEPNEPISFDVFNYDEENTLQ